MRGSHVNLVGPQRLVACAESLLTPRVSVLAEFSDLSGPGECLADRPRDCPQIEAVSPEANPIGPKYRLRMGGAGLCRPAAASFTTSYTTRLSGYPSRTIDRPRRH